MDSELRRCYLKNLLIPVGIYLLIELIYILFPQMIFPFRMQERILPIIILTASAATGLGLTIFYRSYFAHRNRNLKSITVVEYQKFEKNLILLAITPVYFALLGILFNITEFHQYVTILIALYAAYYYYPSTKRLDMDRRIYRVEELSE